LRGIDAVGLHEGRRKPTVLQHPPHKVVLQSDFSSEAAGCVLPQFGEATSARLEIGKRPRVLAPREQFKSIIRRLKRIV
jgi:hypothetical protein